MRAVHREQFRAGARINDMKKTGKQRLLLLVLATLSTSGCDQLAQAVRDGVLDFVESSTADLLEQIIPVPSP
jgi:hypothetical protein